MSADLLEHARGLLIRTMTHYRDDPRTASWLRDRLERLEQPLRIAVGGRVKSGKSTLINALTGTELAPTDAEERTQVTTFYQYGPEPKIMVHTPHGTVQNVPVSTLDASVIRDLQHWRPDEVARLVIESPTPGLEAITLIETPGVASAAGQETKRSALAQILTEADAVLYLTRYPRQTDLQFLQSVNELQTARCVPINTIVALSRADETGTGGQDALTAAGKIAERYRSDPALRAFTQQVVPVAGLLGQAVATMSDDEFKALAYLARLSDKDRQILLLSAERFVKAGLEAVPSVFRQRLLERFGSFGIERSITLLRGGVNGKQQLAEALLEASGLNVLQETVHRQFVERQDALRARSALLAVDMVLRANPRPGVQPLLAEFERLLANAHDWNELRLLSALDSGQVHFARPLQSEARQLLGADGGGAYARLGMTETALAPDLAEAAAGALARWREQAMNPLHDRPHRDAVRTVVRSCERLVTKQVHEAKQQPPQARARQAQGQQAQQQGRRAGFQQPGQAAQRRASAAAGATQQASPAAQEAVPQSPAQRPAAQPAAQAREAQVPAAQTSTTQAAESSGTGRRRRAPGESSAFFPSVDQPSGRRRRAEEEPSEQPTPAAEQPAAEQAAGRRRRADGEPSAFFQAVEKQPTGGRRRAAGENTGRHAVPGSTGSAKAHSKPDQSAGVSPGTGRHYAPVDPDDDVQASGSRRHRPGSRSQD